MGRRKFNIFIFLVRRNCIFEFLVLSKYVVKFKIFSDNNVNEIKGIKM